MQRGGPRDLAAVRDGLRAAGACVALLRTAGGGIGLPDGLGRITDRLAACGADLAATLERALTDEPPLLRRDGGFV